MGKQIKIVKAFATKDIGKELSAMEVISYVREYIPDGYDIPIKMVQGQKNASEDEFRFEITIDAPTIVLLADDKGCIISVYLFAK